jgi:hypothetical protein
VPFQVIQPMVAVRLTWRASRDSSSCVQFVPARLTMPGINVVLAPGETVQIPIGHAVISAFAPGFEILNKEYEIRLDTPLLMQLDPDELVPKRTHPGPHHALRPPAKLSFDIEPWGTRPQSKTESTKLSITGTSSNVTFLKESGRAFPLLLTFVTPRSAPRDLAVPLIAESEAYELAWYQPPATAMRPRVIPTDEGGHLLMQYILMGNYPLAAAAARRVEVARGTANPLDWVRGTYTQLLVGYAHAFGAQTPHLSAWCRRTMAAKELGPDGIVLASESARQSGDPERALNLLLQISTTGLPTLTSGAELCLRLVSLLPSTMTGSDTDRQHLLEEVKEHSTRTPGLTDDQSRVLQEIGGRCLHHLTRADAEAATLSVARRDKHSNPDLAGAPIGQRVIARLRYAATGWHYQQTFDGTTKTAAPSSIREGGAMTTASQGAKTGTQDSGTRTLSGPALWVATFAIASWLLFSVFLLVKADSSPDLAWTRMAWVFGSVQAIAFAAAGALFGTAVQREQVGRSEDRANAAETSAAESKELAAKGQAFGAMAQADEMANTQDEGEQPRTMGSGADSSSADETRRRHAEVSRSLFGDLVPRKTDRTERGNN